MGDIDHYGDALHWEIDFIIKTMKSDLKDTNEKYLSVLITQENKIERSMSEIKKTIDNLKELLDSKIYTLFLLTNPEMLNSEHYLLSFQFHYQTLCLQKKNKQLIRQQFGSLSASSIEAIERKYTMKYRTLSIRRPQNKKSTLKIQKSKQKFNPRANTVNPQRVPLASIPLSSSDDSNWIFSVLCLNDKKRKTTGDENIIGLNNSKRALLNSIKTKSEDMPVNIGTTRFC